jgi:hypothetical protein
MVIDEKRDKVPVIIADAFRHINLNIKISERSRSLK